MTQPQTPEEYLNARTNLYWTNASFVIERDRKNSNWLILEKGVGHMPRYFATKQAAQEAINIEVDRAAKKRLEMILAAARSMLEIWDDLYATAAHKGGDAEEIAVFEHARKVIAIATIQTAAPITLPPEAAQAVKETDLGLTGSKALNTALEAVGPKQKPTKH